MRRALIIPDFGYHNRNTAVEKISQKTESDVWIANLDIAFRQYGEAIQNPSINNKERIIREAVKEAVDG